MAGQQQSKGWVVLTALVLGGTWFAWRLVKNGR